jgi:putative acyl-CoA dehydrogenase
MTNVLAVLALEQEAATVLALRLARAYDEQDERAAVFRRVVTPAAKFWICKRAPSLAVEAMEVLGGNGYVEEFILPRIYREAPVNSIWEGSGNVMCLDLMRALSRSPNAMDVLRDELHDSATAEPRVKAYLGRLSSKSADGDESQARAFARDLILALQAALLVRHAPAAVADAFCASRLEGAGGAFGVLPSGTDCHAIVARAAPALS